MGKINVPIEIPENMDSFLKLLPLNIRKKYMSKMTSAIIKEKEKDIIENVSSIVQEMMQVLISGKDEDILQEELDRALEEIGITMDNSKKTIKGKKKDAKTVLKKESVKTEEVQSTVLKDDVKHQVEKLSSDDEKKKEKIVSTKEVKDDISKEDLTKNDNVQKKVKELNLEEMFKK